MNLHEIKREITITLDQAKISQQKMQLYEHEANTYESNNLLKKSEVYKVRYKALMLHADHLKKQLKKHNGQRYKKVNNE